MLSDPVEITGCGEIIRLPEGIVCGVVVPTPDPFLPDTMAYDPILCDTCNKIFTIEIEDLLDELCEVLSDPL